uniref:NADH-ubiquinone oxidoreductase chain 3 n=1 Tax=Steganacarus magnus TaxID=52000 RepID=B6Z5U9_9ACAR|nr:NADH dehydrogenase subunit 3 [Steganacarus magnus]ACH41150.1 NADH dehydrogenase subunit 3 [Steganacarus magnus]
MKFTLFVFSSFILVLLFYNLVYFLFFRFEGFNIWSPFECGFNNNFFGNNPMSYQFFVIGVLFLIFDVEIALIIPFSVEKWIDKNMNSMIIFLLILIFGVAYEWKSGKIQWLK